MENADRCRTIPGRKVCELRYTQHQSMIWGWMGEGRRTRWVERPIIHEHPIYLPITAKNEFVRWWVSTQNRRENKSLTLPSFLPHTPLFSLFQNPRMVKRKRTAPRIAASPATSDVSSSGFGDGPVAKLPAPPTPEAALIAVGNHLVSTGALDGRTRGALRATCTALRQALLPSLASTPPTCQSSPTVNSTRYAA